MKRTINFTSKFKLASVFSALLVIAAIVLMVTKGLNYGVDFRGGAEVQVKFEDDVALKNLRQVLISNDYKDAIVQRIGQPEDNEFLIKVSTEETKLNEITEGIGTLLQSEFKDQGVEIRKTDIVGPKAGAQLRRAGFQALLWALLAIMVYIGLRFDFKYSPGAIVALFHDVLIIIGVFILTEKEFTLQIVAALLAVIGYSVNDTVVVYDRVREHEEKYAGLALKEHLNNAINETLSRTILTSCTTLFVSLAMLLFGGPVIHDFFFAITLGVLVGTYSSIFIAAPATLFFEKIGGPKNQARKKYVST